MAGIACAGNWILDNVKVIDNWPAKGDLVNIIKQTTGPGGSPFNLLVDFKHIGVSFQTLGFGAIGNDRIGQSVLELCKNEDISTENIVKLENEATSYTDVMSVQSTGERTFFHFRGANAKFTPKHISLELLKKSKVKMFHMGYLLLLDEMDKADDEYGTVAGRLLNSIQSLGIETSIDVVSEVSSTRFKTIVDPVLKYLNHLIINEVEAERITGISTRKPDGTLDNKGVFKAALELLKRGVKNTIVIHAPEGAFWKDKDNEFFTEGLKIPKEKFIGTAGAGDALCAGVLLGLHDNWEPKETLEFACGVAATCIGAENTTDGVQSLIEIKKLCLDWS